MTDPERQGGRDPGFEERLKRARGKIEQRQAAARSQAVSAMGAGFRLSLELVAGVFVGCAVGYGLDWVFGTSPWLLLLFFFLGGIAGVRNMMRAVARLRVADQAAETGSADDEGEGKA
ncbi:MAG: AtpZ/AtpI family protein [Sphingomonadales bacterium]